MILRWLLRSGLALHVRFVVFRKTAREDGNGADGTAYSCKLAACI
jgi:hypothetical protein